MKSEEKKEERLRKSEQSLRNLWDTIKWINIYTVGVPRGEERKRQRLFEHIMAKNFPSLINDMNLS